MGQTKTRKKTDLDQLKGHYVTCGGQATRLKKRHAAVGIKEIRRSRQSVAIGQEKEFLLRETMEEKERRKGRSTRDKRLAFLKDRRVASGGGLG